jgi:hypothetical protein
MVTPHEPNHWRRARLLINGSHSRRLQRLIDRGHSDDCKEEESIQIRPATRPGPFPPQLGKYLTNDQGMSDESGAAAYGPKAGPEEEKLILRGSVGLRVEAPAFRPVNRAEKPEGFSPGPFDTE